MKKVIIAFVLFAGFSMQVDAKNNNQKVKVVKITCLDNWMADYDGFVADGYSDTQAISLANQVYRACLK